MAAPASNSGDIFDIRKLKRLAELLKEYDLGEIDLRQGETRIRLSRGSQQVVTAAPPAGFTPATSAPKSGESAPAPPPPAEDHLTTIKSPMVGTFYTSPNPESPPFIKVGDHVGAETTVCIIEAMKVFNEIPAETTGKIIKVLVENGQPVGFGDPLFKVDPRG